MINLTRNWDSKKKERGEWGDAVARGGEATPKVRNVTFLKMEGFLAGDNLDVWSASPSIIMGKCEAIQNSTCSMRLSSTILREERR